MIGQLPSQGSKSCWPDAAAGDQHVLVGQPALEILVDQPALETSMHWLANRLWRYWLANQLQRPAHTGWPTGFGDLDMLVGQPVEDQPILVDQLALEIVICWWANQLWRY